MYFFTALVCLGGVILILHSSLEEAGRDSLLGLEVNEDLVEFGLLNPDPGSKLAVPPFKRRGGLDQPVLYLLKAHPYYRLFRRRDLHGRRVCFLFREPLLCVSEWMSRERASRMELLRRDRVRESLAGTNVTSAARRPVRENRMWRARPLDLRFK